MAIPYLACMILASKLYGLPPRVLPSIQAVEGGRVGSVSVNADGSADLGVMQINTLWIPALVKSTGRSPDLVRRQLIQEPCFNITVAGAILRLYLDETRNDLMRAVGNYHSHTAPRNAAYQAKVLQAASAMFVRQTSSNPSGR